MDLEPALRAAVRRVAGVLHQYASSKNWRFARYRDFSKGDYYIEIIVNEEWLRFDVTFVAKAFRKQGLSAEFNEVQDWIETELKDDPSLAEAVDLVLRSPEEFDARGFSESLSGGHGDVPIDEEVIQSALPLGKP